jgi:putative Holliday junction resolvase
MCLLGLDIGEKRIGIAISQSGLLAAPYSVLQRKSKQEDFARLGRLIADLKVERIIVGIPYSLSHPERLGPQARRVKRYAQALAQTLTIPLEFVDESYSTVEAQDFLALSGQKKVPLDAAAAAIILQTYIARQPHD